MKILFLFCIAFLLLLGASCDDTRDEQKKCEKCFDHCMEPDYIMLTLCNGTPGCSSVDIVNAITLCEIKCGCVVL